MLPQRRAGGVGIYEGAELVALAAVQELSHGVWEIGFDVVPQRKRSGLGRAVMSAAAEWILARDRLALATTSPWNVPSARTQRSLGMWHFATDMQGVMGTFHVPPSPLGTPFEGAEVYHYYPRLGDESRHPPARSLAERPSTRIATMSPRAG